MMPAPAGLPLRAQIGLLARRSVIRTARTPAQVFPSVAFPLILLAVNSAGLAAATKLPGFPTDSYLTFALAVCFMQAALFGLINAGTGLATDIETGFLKRLALTPIRRSALLAGQLAGTAALGLVSSSLFVLVGVVVGAHMAAGVGGALVVIVLGTLTAIAFGTLGTLIALWVGTGEAVQGMFPLFFVFFFLSSASIPRNLIETDWFRAVATANPISYLIEGLRAPLISGWNGEALGLGFAAVFGILAVGLGGSAALLGRRVVRT